MSGALRIPPVHAKLQSPVPEVYISLHPKYGYRGRNEKKLDGQGEEVPEF
jgi:hypothetical protein